MRREIGSVGFGFGRSCSVFGLVALLMAFVGCGEKQAPKVQVFSPESGAFTCDLPGSPTVTTESVNTPSGAMEVKAYTVAKSEVTYAAKDGAIPQGLAPDAALNAVRDEIVKTSGGKLLLENPLTLGEVPARELMIEMPEGMYSHVRLYVVQGRLFQTSVNVKSKFISPVANKFFTSIKWTQDTPAVPATEATGTAPESTEAKGP